MIGNDLIDLQLAKSQSNWQRKGFLEKQFTDIEIAEILSSENPFLQVWLFWSMKEAAYKCYTQVFQQRFFAPKKFVCSMISKTLGIIKMEEQTYFSTTTITENYIHTVVYKKNTEILTSKLFLMDEKSSQSSQVSNQLLSSVPFATAIQKNEFGVPFLYKNKKKLALSISISHHGKFGAFVVL
ncbi:MAG: 4-phosphopantetheinyl transferase family protein [Flavobacteriia bacterium]|nr:4-phosphopantetheinyl transferase family protein [Flavobacteriia bacterium]OIP47674.1 MAG: hypothetical protein AUK46_03990 [Flavobacteriaceae bacterium CG2_30_31_66]PIV97365.1 MAG: hypothetical protein COW43_02960 [Flavobacteriaceae bacterium CG17_big_fil_post_rev_8_21_14_2_50_31_13]PIX14238.1 MAG: hypothetical protein COZ74_03640 [Flavobacteriaceae bacterium CG_4_8_14_3_um_filter_31_8]PIY14722.1 MAG: hypothetical protein COZ16_07200 [Flavobacteriaceae bacterium CG_4_10_14_3_um_filter_31_25